MKKIVLKTPKSGRPVGASLDDLLRSGGKAETTRPKSPVEREGVFIHGFKCLGCGLHFNVYSWRGDRHGNGKTYCPECGKKGKMLHYLEVVSLSLFFNPRTGGEIFDYCPTDGAELMPDSSG